MKLQILDCKKKNNKYSISVEPKDIFYIDGKGGQLGDRGKIGNVNVLEVHENEILVDDFIENGEYSYTIDVARQEDIAQQHTAQHVFSAIAFNEYNLNTVGFRMAEEYTTVDLDSNTLTEEVISQLEKRVNEVISQEIPLKIFTLDHEEAMKITDLRKSINEKVVGDVRFVEIPEIDLGACAGFHVENTGKIKIFKLINHEKIKGNFTRFYFLAGQRAINDYSFKHMMSRELCHRFSCKDNEILDMVEKTISSKLEAENEVKSLAGEYAEVLAKTLVQDALVVNDKKIVVYYGNRSVGDMLHKIIREDNIVIVTHSNENFALSSQIVNCKELIVYISKNNSEIKGGGNQVRGNFKGKMEKEQLLEIIKSYIENM